MAARFLSIPILVFLVVAQIACGNNRDDEGTLSASTTPSRPAAASESPTHPVVSDAGIQVATVPSVELGWPRIARICKADAYVEVRDGVVVSEPQGASAFTGTVGDPVYRPDGTRSDDGTLVAQPAYMSEDGRIIQGFRECTVVSPPDQLCDDDGRVWEREGIVEEITSQPTGGEVKPGDTVYGPDEKPLFPTHERSDLPVFINESGLVEYGWPSCDPPYKTTLDSQ